MYKTLNSMCNVGQVVRNLCDCPRVLVFSTLCTCMYCDLLFVDLGHILGLYIVDTSRFNESADWNSFVLACIGGN